MKRKFAFIVLCLLGLVSANAQVTLKPGVRAGVNFSQLTQTDFDGKTDFYVGGLAAIRFTRFYTLQPEITYSRQGSGGGTYFNPDAGANVEYKDNIDIDYLTFGIINKFTFNDEWDIHFGPSLDFETSSNVRTNSDLDIAVTAGIGYTLPMGLTIEARVKKGLIDVLETDNYSDYFFVEDYNTNFLFQIGLSYRFDAKGSTK